MEFPRCAQLRAALRVLAVLSIALGNAARGDGALPATGGRETIVRTPLSTEIETLLRPNAAYARAIAALATNHFRAAAERFADAAAEVRRAALSDAPRRAGARSGDGRLSRGQARVLIRRATFEAEQARAVVQREAELKAGSGAATSADRDLQEAVALDNLYLAARAFEGGDVPALRARLEAAFGRALSAPGGDRNARVHFGIAGLLADLGDRQAAAAQFARTTEADRAPDCADFVAHYYAAMGDADRAFEALGAARDTLPDWDEIAAFLRMSNDLDPLRADPRFRRMLGSDENGE